MKIAVAAYPLEYLADWDAYAAKLRRWVSDARDADILVFPEYGAMELAALAGRAVAGDIAAAALAVSDRMAAADALHAALAAEYGVHILAASGPVRDAGRLVNRARLFGPRGLVGHQDKLIMTRFEREVWDIRPGTVPRVFDTDIGRIGVLICYDSEFPLIARAMVEAGAEVLLVPSCTDALAGYWRVRVGSMARALEGQCVVAQSVLLGQADWCPAVDENTGAAGIYGPPDRGFPPTGVLAAGEVDRPGWIMAEVDLARVRSVRAEGQVLNAAHWVEQDDRLRTVQVMGR